ncbi:hypothetical protein L3C95_17580 [Chitinophaga filiformis]|uniref:hypothetical protein n=1 Tax=Chitinophaga filiformis TaxID=104663 RepID=UPI001F44B35B|nr:hypothetical protein [Chitinophaga filiformis]MCF6404713.1 hypothetical protein [Chitinophaga filiformis]
MEIGIFRTNICTPQDKNNVIQAIQQHFNTTTCSIDIEDCDKVMRIVAGPVTVEEHDIILFIRRMGYQCERLD